MTDNFDYSSMEVSYADVQAAIQKAHELRGQAMSNSLKALFALPTKLFSKVFSNNTVTPVAAE